MATLPDQSARITLQDELRSAHIMRAHGDEVGMGKSQAAFFSLQATSSRKYLPQKLRSVENLRTAKTPGPFLRPELVAWGFSYSATGSGFPEDLPDPVFRFENERPLRDFEGFASLLLVSAAALAILETYAGDSIDYRPASIALCDKEGERWFEGYSCCDVVRFEDLLDFDNSVLQTGHTPNIYWEGGSSITFRTPRSHDVHLFRVLNMPQSIFCSRELAKACKAAGLTGAQFYMPGEYRTARL